MRRALACILAVLALPVAAGAGARQVAFVETRAAYDLEGTLAEGASQAFRFPLRDANATRVSFELTWDAPAALSLAVLDPRGRPAAPPQEAPAPRLVVETAPLAPVPPLRETTEEELRRVLAEAASAAGQGEWRLVVRHESGEGPVAFTLSVVVSRYEALVLRVVTLEAAPRPERAWQGALVALSAAALALGAALARRKPPRSVVPPGDKSSSLTPEQAKCAPER